MTIDDVVTAVLLALVFEGLVYAVTPNGMKRMMVMALDTPSDRLRLMGVVVAGLGIVLLWLLGA